jgi:tRNA A37 threonylcarbamoyladenosine modification protein TsaB
MQVIKNGISILDARGNKFYAGVYKNDKLVGKIKIMTPEQISKLATKNKLQVFKDYEDKDNLIFENLFFHLKDFKKVSPTELKSLYIKKPLE